ncbi:MAG TPA: DNRLRE domain-containing protein [Verrucomicrobiae bacterium]|nr:DNRLRE domain-containing protein [Verrucomicrobiae bacterium]
MPASKQKIISLDIFFVLVLVLFGLPLYCSGSPVSLAKFEAESGAPGSDWAISNSTTPAYITTSVDGGGYYPTNASRVITYSVTLPTSGDYQLYAHVRVGPNTFNDDSLFYGNGFGTNDPANASDWVFVNGLASAGFSNATDVVTGGGTLGSGVWKWINLSLFAPSSNPFTVTATNLTQTFQIASRENGLDIDAFAFGLSSYAYTVSDLDLGIDGAPPAPPVCSLNWTNTQQRIDGFGFSSAWCGQLTGAKNNALYNTLGMSILRVRIDETGAWSQETANAAAAHAAGAIVLGSPWSAPIAWTSNGSNSGGYLLPNHYGDYANWLSNAAVSIGIDYISIQNEPDYSAWMNWTAAQIFNFMKTNAPAIGKPVVMPESFHFNDAYSDPVINDPVAVTHFSILGGHFYGGGNYVHTNAIAHGKPVWMTEHYFDGGTTNFPVCLNFAREINDAMNNQFNAYIAWWAQDGDTNINLANSSGTILKDGYTMGQFSKFIRPGFYRVGATNTVSGAQISAYKDLASSNYVIVAINPGSTVITQQFNLNGFPTNSAVTPWLTSDSQSLAIQAPVTNFGSAFTYAIQPSNIVTFVGTVPPQTPANFTAAPGKNQVSLSWNTVIGATSYNVKRATVSGGNYTLLTNVTTAGFGDTSAAFGTIYYYVVSAVNISGESADSAEASAQAMPYFSQSPLADAYVESGGNAAVNFGNSTNLLVKNNVTSGTAFRAAYLMFDVHALTNLHSATVTLVPNRVDDPNVKMYYEIAPNNWTENGITWNNQPGGTGIFLATNTVAAGVPVVIDVTSAAANLATNGGFLSLRITQPTNSLNGLIQFCSKEHPTNSWRTVLEFSHFLNTAPGVTPVASQIVNAGVILLVTNFATDADLPSQSLTFTLLVAPTNATLTALNPTNALVQWRPLVSQAGTTNSFSVKVADNGSPVLSATNRFTVTVNPLVSQPAISSITVGGGKSLNLSIAGPNGPDYSLLTSTNLLDWTPLLTSNSPATPFILTITNRSEPSRFYQIQIGP